MVKIAVLAGLVGSAAAFSAPSQGRVSTSVNLEPITNEGEYFPETFGKVFDPLGLTSSLDERGMRWFQAAEVKHGRVAMMATVGWLASISGFHFGGMLSSSEGISFADVAAAKTPFEALGMVPESGLNQILFVIGAVEGFQEMRQPHYTLPGGNLPGDLGAARAKAEALPRLQAVEVKNGRLAMIGIASFVSATLLPGSVPAMPGFFLPN
mmetsp:Transcript_18937/g.26703  ORF Transcript_18937/g.26703 Transcript_18937/m.26703 type:complete len:210 (+) Transcript_18937:47-676(+)